MKDVIYIDSFIDLEREYMKKHNPYMIEQELLYSFTQRELKHFIEVLKEEYLKEKLPYAYQLWRKKCKQEYQELDTISRYFIEILEYYFAWGQEVELTKNFLDKLTMFYRVNYETKNNYKKDLDIQSIPITEILPQYMKLPENLRRNIRCPLPDHRDRSASFKVYENTNSFHCFGCWKSGNILNLIAEMEWITTKQAYKKLLKIYW